ncbi:MAG: hypothetical protein MUE67_05970 [Anaerolineales bacterium]|jgi:hypothetical protein|nr:hypothetical protein [Anaerolineales bacterium]
MNPHPVLSIRRIVRTWWPLAASWLLMSAETPALTAVMARLENPEVNLAAYGGVVFPLSLIIEAPIIMLLAASTALSKDQASYQRVRHFMTNTAALLTLLHILVAFTPLYEVVVVGILKVPADVVEPARIGLRIMTPWTASIAYRRFNQGVLIRFGRSRTVGVGTTIRLITDGLVLLVGYLLGNVPGIIVATCAVAAGVISEAIYSGIVLQPVLHGELQRATPVTPALSWKAFYAFYIPLAMTSLLTLLANPIGSAALSRMPEALASLAAWPVVGGLIFMLRSFGTAFNEVVVALLDEPHSMRNLRRFATWLALGTSLGLFLLTATPLANWYFVNISGVPEHLVQLSRSGLWLALPLPALTVLQSWFQGAILHDRRTRGITESVVVYILTSLIILGIGIGWGKITGLYFGLGSLTISTLTQTLWLWLRSRPAFAQIALREAA